MPATDTLEDGLLNLIFLNTDLANIGDATGLRGSAAAGNLEFSLHTAALGDTSNQNTSEATYTGYSRQDVARGGAEFTVTAGVVSNDNTIQFGQNTGSSQDVNDVGIGSDVAANELYIYDSVSGAPFTVGVGVNPELAPGDLDVSVT